MVIAVATNWWDGLCMRCGMTWGPWLQEPDDEPYCYEDGVSVMVSQTGGRVAFFRRIPLAKDLRAIYMDG